MGLCNRCYNLCSNISLLDRQSRLWFTDSVARSSPWLYMCQTRWLDHRPGFTDSVARSWPVAYICYTNICYDSEGRIVIDYRMAFFRSVECRIVFDYRMSNVVFDYRVSKASVGMRSWLLSNGLALPRFARS